MKAYYIQMLLVFIFLIILLNVISILRSSKKEKRISDYSLSKKDFDNTTLFDKFNHIIWAIIHLISNILNKSKLLIKYSSNYEKYILIKEEKYKSSIDYVTAKILVIILSILVYVTFIINNIFPFNIFLLIIFIVLGYVIPDLMWQMSYTKKCKNISSKLYESIILIDDNLNKTNIYNIINKIINELDEDISDEYQRIQTDLSYNISLFQAYKRFYERTKIPEIKTIYHLLNIDSNNLEHTFKLIRKEFEYIDQKNALQNSVNVILNILSTVLILIPVVLVLFMSILNFDYFANTISTPFGIIILEFIVALYILMIFVIKRVMEAKR